MTSPGRLRTLAAALLGLAILVAQAQAQTTLRVVPQFDLKILDPIWTTAFTTRNHGYMIYDTLFGVDEAGKPQPQMVGAFEASPDKTVWTFTLRDGLAFHDGAPVTSEDVVASLARWAKRDSLGQKMYAVLDKAEVVDAKTFRLTFSRPFTMTLEALSKPSGVPPFIMPKRVADTPADKQIEDTTGSGPFMLKADEFRPGEKVVYLKNPAYVPRAEPPSGTAGGKVAKVDRVEWVMIKDAQTQVNALVNGEVDMIEWIPTEHYAKLKESPGVELVNAIPSGSYAMHMNHLVPPFDNPKIAKAAILAVNQEALMRAQIGFKELYRTCTSIYPCGSQFADGQTSYFTGKPQFAEAKKLLQEAGYDGKPIVLLYAPEFVVLNKFPPVMAQLLQQAGFKVELQTMDWPSVLIRRTKKDPADKGGWNMFITGWGGPDTMNPLFLAPLTGNGEKGWFGWPTDARLEELKTQFLFAADDAERKKLAEQIQLQVFDGAIFAPVGESTPLTAVRKNHVSGVVKAPITVFWNIEKK
ncbi:ABC transporter substrate-binding protein [Xanthobacter pseudotagetidis]|uniref:ABC transporter substrate-binding protein n=1 Tax=Xanthobacter pseudotagetidis TaxID=3119911 RepID=UPI0037293A4E